MSSCSHTVIRYRSIGTIYTITTESMQFNHILICYTLKNILQFIALLIMIDLENELPAWYHIKVVWDISVDINKINMDY